MTFSFSNDLILLVYERYLIEHTVSFRLFKRTKCVTHLCQLWRLDLLNLEEITDGQEGDGHCTDADHKNDQRRTVVDVASQVLYRI